VIIPCAGNLEDLDELVQSLRSQDADFSWEVIFVDNGLAPPARSVVEAAVERLPTARIVAEAARGISPARNAGARTANGEILAFIDADDVAASSWLRALVADVAPGRIAAGRLDVDRLNPPWLARSRGTHDPGSLYRCEGIFPVAPGGNLAIRKADFERLGGFDPGWPTLEDFELCLRAWRLGIDVQPTQAAATVHYRLRRGPKDLLRQGYHYGFARVRIFRVLHDQGLVGRCSGRGWRSWVLLSIRLVQGLTSSSQRAAAMWLLGNRMGRLMGSIKYAVVYV
jgi:glycosyltransferase involved in cell wall biosynthesis